MVCIWCRETDKPRSQEHIIPEALGCPPRLVLDDAVCRACNSELAFLDRAVVHDLDVAAFYAGVPRKHGKTAQIDSRGNMVGYFTNGGPVIAINMDPRPVTTPEGVRVAAIGKSSRNIRAKLKRRGGETKISFEFAVGSSPLFARGIHKIALNATAYFLGCDTALDPQLDPARRFVRNGTGNRRVLAFVSHDTSYRNTAWAPYQHNDGLSVVVRLAMVEFVADLSPTQSALPFLIRGLERTHGTSGWSVLPSG